MVPLGIEHTTLYSVAFSMEGMLNAVMTKTHQLRIKSLSYTFDIYLLLSVKSSVKIED